jgi:high-affinity nickel permease
MEYYTLLLLGCIVGMQHALEADHLAAVVAMSAGRTSRKAVILRGGVWGLGHTITLLSVCGILLVFGESISPRTESLLEFFVGAMLVLLGGNVLVSLWKRKLHFHFHHHQNGVAHIHAHSHLRDNSSHSQNTHNHKHENIGLRRALLIGMVHGTAGSAGMLVLAAAANSLSNALGFIITFGAGSILGMTTLSFIASYPLRALGQGARWLNLIVTALIGCIAIIIGGLRLAENWGAL